MITSYRDHGHMLACGMDPNGVMAELTGRADGYSKGKGGSMHMFSREKRFFGGHGIVAAQVPLGTGIAFAHKYQADGGLCLCYLGDGAVNQGQVQESLNMAALWKLPIIYVIENNRYAMGTAVERSTADTHLYLRGAAFDIPGEPVDGMDVRLVNAAGEKAVAYVRGGKGPYHPRDEHLPLSRPLDVRSCEISDQGRGRQDESAARSHRSSAQATLVDGGMATEADLPSSIRRSASAWSRRLNSRRRVPSPILRNFGPTF